MTSMLRKMVGCGTCVLIGVVRRGSSRALAGAGNGYATSVQKEAAPVPEAQVTKSVFMSQSTDIYTNLALEDWLYRNYDFSRNHVMMVWRSDPCVVVGRHQNPWQEANLALLKEKEVALARRNSGGGTVYHDRGNLNVSFFMPRERYDRKYNLELIKRALFRAFGVTVDINQRQDLVVNGNYKISGTASKLGRLTAYHHCTLLVNADKPMLSRTLAKNETKATGSTRSAVANLSEVNKRITVDTLQTALGWEYLRTPALHLGDGGQELISKQRGFQYVNPTDSWFPGLASLKSELQSWDWCFGKTPLFTVSRSFPVPSELLPSKVYSAPQELIIHMTVEKGLIDEVTLSIPPGLMDSGFHGEASVVTELKGKRFTAEALEAVEHAMITSHEDSPHLDDKEQFVAKCFHQVVNTN